MKIVVVGGTGRVGASLVERLRARGHESVAASPSTGVDVVSGRGIAAAVAGADAVVDVSKPRSYDRAVLDLYFTAAARTLVAAERAAGVRHHVALAAVGTSSTSTIAYYRAKAAGEDILLRSGIPLSIVHSTQFFEFATTIADHAPGRARLLLPGTLVRPAAADDVAEFLADVASGAPLAEVVEVAGPEVLPLADFVAHVLRSRGDTRSVDVDPLGRYFGGRIGTGSLLPSPNAQVLPTRLEDWLARSRRQAFTAERASR